MVESEIHKLVKEKIAEALREKGYDARTEVRVPQGRLDVLATKEGHKPIKVEVVHTHVPDWVMLEVKGDLCKVAPAKEIKIVEPKQEKPGYWREESPFHEVKRKADTRELIRKIEGDVTAQIIERTQAKIGRLLTDSERKTLLQNRDRETKELLEAWVR